VKKYIIGLGDSWTQGEGGYPKEIVEAWGGRTQWRGKPGQPESDYCLRIHELENSWVNQLCKYHFPDYTSINLGVKGIGNEAAVKQLYFVDNYDLTNCEGIIILLLSGADRKSLLNGKLGNNKEPDHYSSNFFHHRKWSNLGLYYCALMDTFSDPALARSDLINLLVLQDIAKARNMKLIVANAFYNGQESYPEWINQHTGPLYDKFDWSCYLHNNTEYISFVQELVRLDSYCRPDNDKLDLERWREYDSFYNPNNLKTHSEYLTNDEGTHPTIKGYRVIADEMAKFIREKNYI